MNPSSFPRHGFLLKRESRPRSLVIRALGIYFAVASLAGCARDGSPDTADDTSAGGRDAGPKVEPNDLHGLPRVHYPVCGSHLPPGDGPTGFTPSVCIWALATDRIVFGYITALEVLDEPITNNLDLLMAREDCATLNPSMHLRLQVTEELYGSGEGAVDVYTGGYHVTRFEPQPVLAADGEVKWEGLDTSDTAQPLRLGQRVGMAIRWVEGADLWSLMGEPIFEVTESGKVQAQELEMGTPECEVLWPSELFGEVSLASLSASIEACSDADSDTQQKADERRDLLVNWWSARPDAAYAATCVNSPLWE